jgi:DNA replication and repair protein RecF
VRLDRLWLADFRNYAAAELTLPAGLTVVVGDNGAGKTNLLEAIGYLATLSSFRGVPNDALVRTGASAAVVRGEGERAGRALLIEAEIHATGRSRVNINRQPVRRSAELVSALRVSVFSPDDLELVKGGPTGRRRYLDETLAALHPRNDATRRDFERIVRQRNALLAQASTASRHAAGGKLTDDMSSTLDVWNSRLVEVGEAVGASRADLVSRLEPALAKAYAQLTGDAAAVTIRYDAPWRQHGLAAALAHARRDELRRGVSLVGPHRDELVLAVNGLPSRTHASQGEQRSLALALRLAAHDVVTELVGEPPLLLLDDVFSELDRARSRALLAHLPGTAFGHAAGSAFGHAAGSAFGHAAGTAFGHAAGGQAVLTTAGDIPESATPERIVRIESGRLVT